MSTSFMVGVVCAVIGLLGPGSASVDRLLGIDDALAGAVGLALTVGLGVLGPQCCWWPPGGRTTHEADESCTQRAHTVYAAYGHVGKSNRSGAEASR
jgi:hypothetical protein